MAGINRPHLPTLSVASRRCSGFATASDVYSLNSSSTLNARKDHRSLANCIAGAASWIPLVGAVVVQRLHGIQGLGDHHIAHDADGVQRRAAFAAYHPCG